MENAVPPHDAQRTLEQRALRNVRTLVDKLETGERRDTRRNVRLVAWVLVALMLAVAGAYVVLRIKHGPVQSGEITMKPLPAPASAR